MQRRQEVPAEGSRERYEESRTAQIQYVDKTDYTDSRGDCGEDYADSMKAAFGELEAVVRKLRSEDGCPWDRAQTLESLRPCMVNEMAEAVGAISLLASTGDAGNLCEELGDVLLQVVMLSCIAQEQGLFTVEDVIRGITAKMIRRHPHVFGADARVEQQEVPGRWEAIKKAEKKGRTDQQEAQEKAALREALDYVRRQLDETEQRKLK